MWTNLWAKYHTNINIRLNKQNFFLYWLILQSPKQSCKEYTLLNESHTLTLCLDFASTPVERFFFLLLPLIHLTRILYKTRTEVKIIIFFFFSRKLHAELGLFLLPEGAAAWLHGDSWPCATLQIMLLLISPGFVLAPLLVVSDFMVRRSQRSDKLHDGQSCYWRRKSEMPLPAVSGTGMERKIISFTINLPDVSSHVPVSVEESCGTAVTQRSSQAQLCCKCFWVCLAQYIFQQKRSFFRCLIICNKQRSQAKKDAALSL